MKKLYCLFGVLIFFSASVSAQDEGTIVKRERINRHNNVFISVGPSFTFGKNIGDYNTGYNFEAGYLKRVNRLLSVGPSISYLNFEYDPEKTGDNNIFVGEDSHDGSYDIRPALFVDFSGGTINLTSIAFTVKLNFIPVRDDSKLSVYGFAKPFVSFVNRTEVAGKATYFEVQDRNFDAFIDEEEILYAIEFNSFEFDWEANEDFEISDDLKENNSITGGIFIGPGVEYNPAKTISIFAQAAFGYTFPVSFISTEKYKGQTLEDFDIPDQNYPMIKKGFPSINIQFGVSFNF